MFALNFKKEWRMNKSLLLSFMTFAVAAFLLIVLLYLIITYSNLSENVHETLLLIWTIITGLVSLVAAVLPIVLIFLVLKRDLGKRSVHHTIFTPQSISAWYFPKVLYIFIIQGLFALFSLGSAFLLQHVTGEEFNTSQKIITFLITTFSIGYLALFTISMAIYYTMRNKGKAWLFIVIFIVAFEIIVSLPVIIMGFEAQANPTISSMLTTYGVEAGLSIISIAFAFYLFDKKVEY